MKSKDVQVQRWQDLTTFCRQKLFEPLMKSAVEETQLTTIPIILQNQALSFGKEALSSQKPGVQFCQKIRKGGRKWGGKKSMSYYTFIKLLPLKIFNA